MEVKYERIIRGIEEVKKGEKKGEIGEEIKKYEERER